MHPVVTCGWCGSDDTDAEFVDIGVGWQQVTAAECNHCSATQMSLDDLYSSRDIDPEDRKRGWYTGPDTVEVLLEDVAAATIHATDYKNGEIVLIELDGITHWSFKRVSHFASPTFQTMCGDEIASAVRPKVEAVTCFTCIAYESKGRP